MVILPTLLNQKVRKRLIRPRPPKPILSPRRTIVRQSVTTVRSIILRLSRLATLKTSAESLRLIKKIKRPLVLIPLNELNKLKRKSLPR